MYISYTYFNLLNWFCLWTSGTKNLMQHQVRELDGSPNRLDWFSQPEGLAKKILGRGEGPPPTHKARFASYTQQNGTE
jgi:hypothetical protein